METETHIRNLSRQIRYLQLIRSELDISKNNKEMYEIDKQIVELLAELEEKGEL